MPKRGTKKKNRKPFTAVVEEVVKAARPIIRCACFRLGRRSADAVFTLKNPPPTIVHGGRTFEKSEGPLPKTGLQVYLEVKEDVG